MKNLFIPPLAAGIAILLFCGACRADTTHQPTAYKDAVRCGRISSPQLSELSGFAVSRKTPGLLWAINDSGNPPVVYGLSTKGTLLKTYKVSGATNWDWEDLAGFRYRGEDFLVIGDVGDNWSARPFNTLYCVKEPAPGNQSNGTMQLEWEMTFRYENGPQDCEAVAVDAANQKIYLLSKRSTPPVLYELPLDMPCKKSMYTARAVAKIKNSSGHPPKAPKKPYANFRSLPTAMDISADGNTLYILTYKHAYVYSRTPDQPWDPVFSNPPLQITLPSASQTLVQREALGLDQTSGNIFITSEKKPAPIYVVEPIFPRTR
ncbi:hypothetical protein [Desulfobacter curvatus]|uniref:hypothetical protein n=1 Tax=Desulfobacter curvatus TaxID=2290 RepID=UPI0003681DA2|nr:hypothetical protein [Desulfobacter curvatus]